MIEKVPYINPINDERYDPEYISEYFTCANIECKDYFTRHVHLYNIDPRVPFKAIEPEKYREMLAQGWMCEQQDCEWREHLHLHIPAQRLYLMVGDKYNPEILENVIDERADSNFIAEYFLYTNKRCN